MAEKQIQYIYQFKITLKGVRLPIRRRIQVPESFNFKDLHFAIQTAMGWENCYLHHFKMHGITIRKMRDEVNECKDEAQCLIKDWFKVPKQKAMYYYDFGEGLDHAVELEKIEPAQPGESYPKCYVLSESVI